MSETYRSFINFIEKTIGDFNKNLISKYPKDEVDKFIKEKYDILNEASKKYMTNPKSQFYKFFNFIYDMVDYKLLLYCFYILTKITYPDEEKYIEYANDTYQNEYQSIDIGYPSFILLDEDTKFFIYFFIIDFLRFYNIPDNKDVYNLIYDPLLNELIRFLILYLISNYISDTDFSNDDLEKFKILKFKVQSSPLNEKLENFFYEVIDEDDFTQQNQTGIRFIDNDEYISFNYVMSIFFQVEEQKSVQLKKINPMTTYKFFDKQSIVNHYLPLLNSDINKYYINTVDYLDDYVKDKLSLVYYSSIKINFRGVDKKIVFLGERHDKVGKEVEYIKTEFQKICEWNNKNKTNIKIDFLTESSVLYSKLFGESSNLVNAGVECIDDTKVKNLISLKGVNFLDKNYYNKNDNTRTCDINKCFNDVYYNNIDYRNISSNYFIRFTDFSTFEKFISPYRFGRQDIEKYEMKIKNNIDRAIDSMENERVKYNYVTSEYYIIFGNYNKKNNKYVNSITKLYERYRNIDNIKSFIFTERYMKIDPSQVDAISNYIFNLPTNTVIEYVIRDNCNFYNYVFKEYFPYVYYMSNNIDENLIYNFYKRYIEIYGFFPEKNKLKELRYFYTNEHNIFEYEYCKSLIECIEKIDYDILNNYLTIITNIQFIYNLLFIYDPYLRRFTKYKIGNIMGLTPSTYTYMDIFLLNNILLPYTNEYKKQKDIPENNDNIVVYCGAAHSRYIMEYFKSKWLVNDNYLCIQKMDTLEIVPCFSNFFIK